MSQVPERIAAAGLVIRRWRLEDAPGLAAAVAASIDHLRPWMSWAASEPLSEAQRVALLAGWQRDWERGRDRFFGMFLRGEVVGACGLHHWIGPGGLEIGYWVHSAHLRKGYATAAAEALARIAFSLPEISHVEIHHDQANVASGGVARKLGFRHVGEEPDGVSASGDVGISWIWRMERGDWSARQPGAAGV